MTDIVAAWTDQGWCDACKTNIEAHPHEPGCPIAEIERLRAALHEVYSQLTNMQPHIASLEEHCGNVGRTRFIDDHVDAALDVARKALESK